MLAPLRGCAAGYGSARHRGEGEWHKGIDTAAADASPPFSGENAQSPFQIDLAVDISLTGISAAAALATYLYGENLTRTHYSIRSRSGLNRLDRSVIGNDSEGFRIAGDIGSVAVPAAALCMSLMEYPRWGWNGVAEDFLIVGETLAISSCLENITVNLFPRRRPYMYDLRLKLRNERRTVWDTRSFYSGHAASPFAATTAFSFIFTMRRPQSPWVPLVWAASMAASSLVAVSRPLAGEHF
ncbi:MAG: phosphatase PAP2 family protein [Spirochaetes bacterium]|nr:phosphatase PAP2 family protein [Spirochaetota bacterium]